MNAVGRAVSGAAGRVRPRPKARTDGYVFCAEDGFWFRPAYTGGTCPLCGREAAGQAAPAPLWGGADRSWYGVAALVLESLVMLALVLFMFFRG